MEPHLNCHGELTALLALIPGLTLVAHWVRTKIAALAARRGEHRCTRFVSEPLSAFSDGPLECAECGRQIGGLFEYLWVCWCEICVTTALFPARVLLGAWTWATDLVRLWRKR